MDESHLVDVFKTRNKLFKKSQVILSIWWSSTYKVSQSETWTTFHLNHYIQGDNTRATMHKIYQRLIGRGLLFRRRWGIDALFLFLDGSFFGRRIFWHIIIFNNFYSCFAHTLHWRVIYDYFSAISMNLSQRFLDCSNMRVNSFNPAGVVPDYMFVIEFWHSLYLFINVVRLDVLLNRQVNLNPFYRI